MIKAVSEWEFVYLFSPRTPDAALGVFLPYATTKLCPTTFHFLSLTKLMNAFTTNCNKRSTTTHRSQ